MTNGLYEAKRPMTVLAGRYGHPLHPMLVTVPIGAWIASLVFDIASRLVADPAFLARGSEWLIAVGVVGALAAAVAGILDFYVIQPGTRAYRTVVVHMSLNLLVTTAFGADFVWRYGSYHRPGPVLPGQIAASGACLGLLALSGYLGGKLSYRYGVRVADERTQAGGFTARRPEPALAAQAAPAGSTGPAGNARPATHAGSTGPAGYARPATHAGSTGPAGYARQATPAGSTGPAGYARPAGCADQAGAQHARNAGQSLPAAWRRSAPPGPGA
jgi:uncharacterized membrane protein